MTTNLEREREAHEDGQETMNGSKIKTTVELPSNAHFIQSINRYKKKKKTVLQCNNYDNCKSKHLTTCHGLKSEAIQLPQYMCIFRLAHAPRTSQVKMSPGHLGHQKQYLYICAFSSLTLHIYISLFAQSSDPIKAQKNQHPSS